MRAWQTLASADTPDGVLELRQRGEGDFLITQAGRVLMNSAARRSEEALGALAAQLLAARARPRLLLGGLGMGCTLRSALDGLPEGAQLTVAELHRVVAEWCRGPLAGLNGAALGDPRVRVEYRDVAEIIRTAAPGYFDAIVLDLYVGPHPFDDGPGHPHYGPAALERCRAALTAGGVLAIWSEDPDSAFAELLTAAGFAVREERPGRGGRRHVVYLATIPDAQRTPG